jgi:penicillin amidase
MHSVIAMVGAATAAVALSVSALPPGESGFFPIGDQARYEANGNPSDFGPHVDDQREPYWHFHYEPNGFEHPTGTATRPHPGVRIYRDSRGVPLIYGKTGRDVWFGAGYAAAQDRLFEMDAIRRLAEGKLAEFTGAGQVPADLEARTLTYTHHEYLRMFHRLPARSRDAIAGYAAGVEARVKQVNADPARMAPGEDVLLSTDTVDPEQPQTVAPWTIADTMAAGVFITRDVASQGGNEMDNVAALRTLEKRDGKARGRKVFGSLFADNDPKAAVTIHGQHFSNVPTADRTPAAAHRDVVRAENYADTLPLALRNGPGTGHSRVPSARTAATSPYDAAVLAAARRLDAWGAGLHGGSFAYAVSGSRTRSGKPMLASNPQLAYSYPSELWELQVHGGGYDARGVGVPGIPTVGIGRTPDVAWGLTTGYSKTIDSFIERTRPNPKSGGSPQYRHRGRWHDESCHRTRITYRAASPQGVPAGPGAGPTAPSVTARICRTDHGPVVATADHGRLSRSVDYAMWKHDDDTVTGILDWDRARNLRDVIRGVKHVTWNENIVAATSGGDIGYWHPGRYFRRAPGVDQRFPLRGNGSQDERGYFSYRRMPHVINPAEGYAANWNTKPAHGWTDGDLSGTNTRPGGPANRVVVVQRLLARAHHATAASMDAWDRRIGESDDRAIGYLPAILADRHDPKLTSRERTAMHLLERWDGRAFAPGAKHGSSPLSTPAAHITDGPSPTVFAAVVRAIKSELFGSLPASIRRRLDTEPTDGTHAYDVTPLDNEALRVLRPGYSGLRALGSWAHGRSPHQLIRQAMATAVKRLDRKYGTKPSRWRRPHAVSSVESLTGVVGPSEQMPFEDRGTWVQHVTFR